MLNASNEIVNGLKMRIIDCLPMSVNHLCEYTREYVQRVLKLPRVQDYGFKIRTADVRKFLQIKYTNTMTNKIMKEIDLTDEFLPYRIFIDKFRGNLA
jgi:hypothetical protein